MNYARKPSAVLIGLLALWVWRETYALSCISLLIPLGIVGLITFYARDLAMQRRLCWVRCFVDHNHGLSAWLKRTHLSTAVAIFSAFIATVALVSSMTFWPPRLLWVLLADALLLTLIFIGLQRWTKNLLQHGTHAVIIKHWSVTINTLVLLTGLVLAQLYSPIPQYLQAGLLSSLQAANSEIISPCSLIENWIRLAHEVDALSWWLMERGNQHLQAGWPRGLAWSLFLLSNSLSAWAFSRLLAQLLHLASADEPPHEH